MRFPVGHGTRLAVVAGALAAVLSGLAAPAALAQDDVKKELEDLRKRISELEAKSAGGAAAPADASAVEEAMKKGLPTKKGNSTFKFYGFLRLDMVYDDSSPNNTQTLQYILSEDPNATVLTTSARADRDDADFTMHARLTRFGMDFDGGKVAALGDAKLTGKLEIDFYNNGLSGQAESRAALRMRHAYLDLATEGGALKAGQTSDLIAPLWPFVNPDMVNWGAGNLGDRRPQLRYTRSIKTSKVNEKNLLTLAGMIGLTGAVDNQNNDGAAEIFRDGEASGYPMGQFRAAMNFATGKAQSEVGFWGHYGRESSETKFAGEDQWESTSLGIDVKLPFAGQFTLQGELWTGRNLDDVRGGIAQGINLTTGNEIHSQGGWIELKADVSKTTAIAAGFSEDNPDDSDLGAGGRERNRVVYTGVHFNFDPVEFGIDVMNWHTSYKGVRGGVDNRIQGYIAYNF
jgi:hypothetical protein